MKHFKTRVNAKGHFTLFTKKMEILCCNYSFCIGSVFALEAYLQGFACCTC